MTIVVAGAGIAGLSFALTCHEIGCDVRVFEAAREIRPLGVGINLQPNAVRELYQLGMEPDLREIGIEAEEWALFFYGAHPIWTEPRGTLAGYNWPQFSVHRGELQMRLLNLVGERIGTNAVESDARLVSYESKQNHVVARFRRSDGTVFEQIGDLLVGADGIHSAVRSQMHPTQDDVRWNGAIMWRGVSRTVPPRTHNSFVLIGGIAQRFVCYPVQPIDANGNTLLNWIAELRSEGQRVADRSDWNRPAKADVFIDAFQDWRFGWIDVPEIVGQAEGIWEYPMVDRDPVSHWVEGRTALIGDAAHAMQPHGSGGASQAIVDGRVLGACLVQHGLTVAALKLYQSRLLEPVNKLVLRNRNEGPLGVFFDIEERVRQGQPIDKAIDTDHAAQFMTSFKQAAGIDRDWLNDSPPIIDNL